MDFSGLTILCLGDVMLDRFVSGEIERISPEAPVPVLRLSDKREMPGGVGNVAANVASLGGRAVLIGLVGGDEAADALRRALPARVEDALVRTTARPTICKTRFIAGRQQVVRADEESAAPLQADEEEAIVAAVRAHLHACDAVICSDYGKGTLSQRVLREVLDRARVPVMVDPKRRDFAAYRGATCITPNLRELAAAAGASLPDEASIVAAARRQSEATGADFLVTRSERGMILVERSGAVHSVPARAREVFDVSGAGDTVIAALTLAHVSGRTLARAMPFANAAAGVAVSKLGTATVALAEVMHELAAAELGEVPPVLQTESATAALVAHWRRQGLSVGFTNGCFDILHPGHVSLLEFARGQCDRLVVALNADASVARLKGPQRPVNSLAQRARVIAAIRHVDCVTSFAEDTPLRMIELLLPDVLVKGADYALEDVVGGDVVLRAGGRVVLAELIPGQSTTGILRKVTGAVP